MVVYNKKVSKRRRKRTGSKRTGSKRNITKHINKRMNRSRQMGGAAPGRPAPLSDVSQVARDAANAEQHATTPQNRPGAEPNAHDQEGVEGYAREINTTLREVVANQQGLCTNIKGAIGDLITRVKKCDGAIDLSELLRILTQILSDVLVLNGQCDGLGALLRELETRLIEAGCLEGGIDDGRHATFLARLNNIDNMAPGAGGRRRRPPAPPPAGGDLARQRQIPAVPAVPAWNRSTNTNSRRVPNPHRVPEPASG